MPPETVKMKKLLIILILLISCLACSDSQVHNPAVATVNGASITLDAFRGQSAFMGLGSDPMALNEDLRLQVLEVIISRTLMLQEAEKLNIRLDVNELDHHEAMVRQGLDDTTFEKKLIEQGILYEQWREILRQDLLARKALEMIVSPKVHISAEMVRIYFEEHKDDFARPERVLAQHALFPNRQAAQKVAELMRAGKDLGPAAIEAKVVLDEQTEPTWLMRGYIPESMEKVIFGLQPGKVAGPITSDYGFHVVKVLVKQPAEEANLAEAAEEIQRLLGEEEKIEQAAVLLRRLREEAKIWIDDRFIASGQIE